MSLTLMCVIKDVISSVWNSQARSEMPLRNQKQVASRTPSFWKNRVQPGHSVPGDHISLTAPLTRQRLRLRYIKVVFQTGAIIMFIGAALSAIKQVADWKFRLNSAHAKAQRPARRIKLSLEVETKKLFASSQSLGAIAIGVAEGTRTPDGGKTPLWDYHIDPGNGAINQGTFSWQLGATSPEAADQVALMQIRDRVIPYLIDEAKQEGIKLDRETLLQGVDLWTQAPKAGRDFIENLKRCQSWGHKGSNAVLCARIEGYHDPYTGELQASGFRNDLNWLRDNQIQRMTRIERTLRQHYYRFQD